MPIQISRLKCLRTLTKFVVNKNVGFQIGELGKLPNLRGAILIAKLQDVINPTDALFCLNLPSLGQLPSLQNLSIVGFDEVVKVGPDFYGGSSSTITPFQSLKKLNFERMLKWEEWFSYEGGAFPHLHELRLEDCPKLSRSLPKHLPSLTTIWILKCSKLGTSLPRAPAIRDLRVTYYNDMLLQMNVLPPTLHMLRMGGFDNLESLPNRMLSRNNCLKELMIYSAPLLKSLDLKSGSLLTTLKKLSILNCRELQFPMYPCYSSLESFYISYSCNTLKSFPLHIFPKLCVLRIETCSKMESLSVLEGHRLIDLMSLKIEDCPNFVAFPSGGFPAPNLIRLLVNKCQRLNSMPTNMHRLLPSLQHSEIRNCLELKSFPKVDAKPLQTAQEAQHVTAPSVHFVLTSMSSPTPVFTIKIIKLTRQWSRGTEGGKAGSWPKIAQELKANLTLSHVKTSNKQERLDFLYNSGLAVGKGSNSDGGGFKALEVKTADTGKAGAAAAASSSAPASATPGALFEDKPQSANDVWRKLHSDPLLMIRQREQEALARIKINPVQMAMIRKSNWVLFSCLGAGLGEDDEGELKKVVQATMSRSLQM
nr:putative disease resistance protein [Quercus suber]